MDYKKQIIKKENYIVADWSGGKTSEMYIYPPSSNYKKKDFYFRISSATVELEESNFTKLKGVERWITTLEGKLKLTHDYEEFINLKPFQIYEFDGQIETHSYGKVRDFNLMLANGAKGKLENIVVDKEEAITISPEVNKKEFHVFYSPHDNLSILLENEEIFLEKEDLLILELEGDKTLNIKFKAKGKINMLYSKVTSK